MKEIVQEIAERKRATYRGNYREMIADFKGEIETNQGYNGRQILELIQNCDDEGADEILIKLNKVERTIRIYNTGKSFSEEGYNSLSISNLSSKTSKKSYIGNKGLGFRSIINWSDQIRIFSNDIILTFSEEVRRREYLALTSEEIRLEIERSQNFPKGLIPLPFIAIPDVESYAIGSHYSTIIEIRYKIEFFESIIEQVKKLKPEILLFLKSINLIRFDGFEDLKDIVDLKRTREKLFNPEDVNGPKEKITINNQTWSIYFKEGTLSQVKTSINTEEEFFELKLAVKSDLSDKNGHLFSYFPTTVRFNYPYLIHGTFDLDQNRNQLNNTEKNQHVLKNLVDLMMETALHLTKNAVNWFPLQILSYNKDVKDERLEELGFYSEIYKAIISASIFPCLDGKYRTKNEVVKLPDDLSSFLQKNSFVQGFENVLIPSDNNKLDWFNLNKELNNLESKIDTLSESLSTKSLRAELIYILNLFYPEKRFSLLLDQEQRTVKKHFDVYTPAKDDIKIPEFCKVNIIDKDLYDLLLIKFGLDQDKDKARSLQRKIKGNYRIHSYEPITLAQKIISLTLKQIENYPEYKKTWIIQMLDALYYNYQNFSDRSKLPEEIIVPILNKTGEVKNTRELILSEFSKKGRNSFSLFDGVYSHEDYIALPPDLGFTSDIPEESIESFLLWLGVNEYVVYQSHELMNLNLINGLSAYLEKVQEILSSKAFNSNKANIISVNKLERILKSLSIEKIICWIHIDKILQKQLSNEHTDRLSKYFNNNWHGYGTIPFSFLKFNFFVHGYNLENHLLETLGRWFNKFEIDYEHDVFKQFEMSRRDIDNVLVLLGSKDEFNQLSIQYVTEILKQLPTKFPNGQNSNSVYKKALLHFQTRKQHLTEKVDLFADNGQGLKLFNPQKVYFSDKVNIPNRLKETFPILNFPSRSGGMTAIEFFGINNLNNIEFKVSSIKKSSDLSEQLQQTLKNLKPYILVHRLDKVDKEDLQKNQASRLNQLKITLCTEVKYNVENEEYEVGAYEYIKGENSEYFVRISERDNLNDVLSNSVFSDSFSDILVNLFDVFSDRSEYRYLIRGDLNDVDYSLRKQFGDASIARAQELIGDTDYEKIFWEVIEKVTALTCPSEISNADYKNEWSAEINFEKINSNENKSHIKNLFEKLQINLSDFNRYSSLKLEYTTSHKIKLASYFTQMSHKVKSTIWCFCDTLDEKKHFLTKVKQYTAFQDFIENKAIENKENFDVNPVTIFNEYIKSKFGDIEITQEVIDLTSLERESKTKFSDSELIEIDSQLDLRSLMYFKDCIEFIKSRVKENSNNNSDSGNDSLPPSNHNLSAQIMDVQGYFTHKKSEQQNNSRGPYIPKNSDKKNGGNKIVGNRSEQIVYDELVLKYGLSNVDWVSRMDEGEHFDIKYSEDSWKTIKYVEVKTYSNGSFILTRDERIFGEKNKENYEIWLVDSIKRIFPIKNFFLSNDYNLNPTEYEVIIELKWQ